MRKFLLATVALTALISVRAGACTNVIITKGASSDGSCMVSYAADSHWLYGELYFKPAADYAKGSKLPIIEWDTYKPLGSIDQVEHTYQTMGNMNEHQLIIGETTWGGRWEQVDTTGIMDYGSLIYITLQRASTAREAIQTIVQLANDYGYPSMGETFSIADKEEAWIMDLVGKGPDNKGIVYVARRIPDGYICAHANLARITTFPWNDPENCIFAPDVAEFARSKGWFSGADEEFDFRAAYCPIDFGEVRGCDGRVWSAFNILGKGNFIYEENGEEVCKPASDWLDYAMGYDLESNMPLWVKPADKVTPKNVADVMRDHFEGTPMDMRTDIGAGGNACPYRWRPMDFEWEGESYVNERAIATQQTGFWFVAQARGWLPDTVGALVWFGVDDAATSYVTPIYVNSTEVPECVRVGNGDLLHYSPTSAFWMCNRVTNACYRMYDQMEPVVRREIDAYEYEMMFDRVPKVDDLLCRTLSRGGKRAVKKARKAMTNFTVDNAQRQFENWVKLEEMLTVKFIDGNVKAQDPDGNFLHSEYHTGTPEGLEQPGYTDFWKQAVAWFHGKIVKVQ